MLRIEAVGFAYGEKRVLNDINLRINPGNHVALLGESGCGKSTLLQLIYGLHDANEGSIYWNDKAVLGPKFNLVPGVDQMKYLAQDFDLMPHITVAENVGKYLSNINITAKKARVGELLELVEMSDFADVKAKFLSGGQQQRVALARVLAVEPELLLLDEPFSHIDNFRRSALRRNLFSYLKSKGICCIVATHDSIDALGFADQTIIMKDGQIVAAGNSKDLYEFPESKYIASLFGEVNELPLSDFDPEIEGQDTMLLYPHQLMVSSKGVLDVEVKECYFKGDGYLVKAALNRRAVFFDHPLELEKGLQLKLALKTYQ
ncbi:ABC transporter ATP-binding protein [Flavobacterium sp. NKUCC04_CG]|uniref:ABC transporter ATP-binding protein n=1 Tax=Flavobacterium sp. NKUCC04_CG TaxID=2842121 RepID=UPI001C5B2C69|nr:ABC transporter ATP-binding protein [Flavobacterium sp. NKUCC04_CG]MBW3519541.1 ABC transporter ATP-binding protein [Flavobacterium sp. NKUCC04_CG]